MITLWSDFHCAFPEGFDEYVANAKEDDLLILLGDTGLWFPEGDSMVEAFTERFLSLPIRVALIDGNHENFDKLFSHPRVPFGGKSARALTDRIVLLDRGEIYEMEGKTFFTLGGCASSPKWHERQGLWSEKELPTEAELARAAEKLAAAGNRVDYILTHYYNRNHRDENLYDPGTANFGMQKFCRYLDETVDFKKWYIGHWHIDRDFDDRHHVVYRVPVTL